MDAHGDYLNLRPQNPDTARCNLTQYRHGDRGAVPVVTGVVVPDAVPNTTIRNIRNQLIQSDPAYDWMYSSAHLPRTREQSRPRARGDQYSFLPKQTHGLSRVEIAPGDRFVLEMKNMRQLIGSRPRKVASWSDARYDDLVEDKQNLSTGRMQFPARMERILVRARRNAEQFDQFESLYAAKQELRAMLHHVVAKARRIEVDDKELLSWLCTAMHRQPTRDGVDHRFSYHDTASQIYKRNRLHHRRQYQENDIHIYTDARGHGGTYAAASEPTKFARLADVIDLSKPGDASTDVSSRSALAKSSPAEQTTRSQPLQQSPSATSTHGPMESNRPRGFLGKVRDIPPSRTPDPAPQNAQNRTSVSTKTYLQAGAMSCMLCSRQFSSKQSFTDHCTQSKCSGRLRKVVEALCDAALEKSKEQSDSHSRDGSGRDSDPVDYSEGKHKNTPKPTKRGSRRKQDKLHKTEANTRITTRAPSTRTPTRTRGKKRKTKVTRRSKRLRNISDKNDSDSPPIPSASRAVKKKKRFTRRSKRLRSGAGNQNINQLSPQVTDDDVDGFVIRSTVTR